MLYQSVGTGMKHRWIAILLLVLVVAAVHGRSLTYGLMLDDFNHRAELREGDWSFRSLVDAASLGDPRRRVRMWWQDEARQQFFRPVAFALMRLEYEAVGWRPWAMHLFSLAWTTAGGLLVMALGRRALGSLGWAWLAAVLFAVHPGAYLTGRWIACQNEQMATAFMLAAILLYARYSDWRWDAAGQFAPADDSAGAAARSRSLPFAVGAVMCWVPALGCRENAVMLFPLLVLGDVLLRPARWRGRCSVYGLLLAVLIGFILLRQFTLGGAMLPGRPYAYPTGEPGFVRFIADKFIYYVLALFALVPVIGFTGLEALRQAPAVFYGLFAGIIAVCLVAIVLSRRRVLVFWLLMATMPLAPVLPVFASSHHLYMPAAGASLAVVSSLCWLVRWSRARTGVPARAVRGAARLAIVSVAAIFVGANVLYDTGMAAFSAASQLPADEAVRLGRPLRPGDRLFFINLPMMGFNCMPAIEEARGVYPLTGYVLTFAPSLLVMEDASCITRLDSNRLRIRATGDPWFSGLEGRSILAAVGRDAPFRTGETFSTPDFDVLITENGPDGVREIEFTFRRPLDDPGYHFFLASPRFMAYPLTWPSSGVVRSDTPRSTATRNTGDTLAHPTAPGK
jgi:hypothetical protein